MCGIVGKLYFNNKPVAESGLKAMADAIAHRGPNQAGFWTNNNVGFGFRRLSIIDLSSAGNQPMSDREGMTWIVFNGEIYNFRLLRQELEKDGVKFKSKTDTEIIIYLYKKYGIDCLQKLRGMFAFAIWDENKKQLFLARDRLGKKPLKYYYDKNVFIFASELKAILKCPEVKKEPDFEALDEYLTYQYVPHPKTGFKNIWKLPPAHYMIVKSSGEVEQKQYWQIDHSKKICLSEKEWEEKIVDKLRESVRSRLVADVPLGAHLSGGIDSSLIVALMAQETNEPVKTFSIGFKESEFNELPYAKMVADKYKTDHHEFIVEPKALEVLPKLAYHYEEPFADSSALPTWYLCEITKQHVTVALNGDGGDENFAGYERYSGMKFFNQLKYLPAKQLLAQINRALYHLTNVKIFSNAYRWFQSYDADRETFYRNIIDYLSQKDKKMIYAPKLAALAEHSRWRSFLHEKFQKTQGLDWLDQLLSVDINSYLPDDLLVKVDIASMAHALEVRSPFLDHEFMELMAMMPSELKIKGASKKYILKRVAENYLPPECLYRRKQGFSVPLKYWFRNELADYLKSFLNKNFASNYGLNQDGIRQMIDGHVSGKENYANSLWAILFLCQWLKIWFEN